jgi:hypothetical protein
MRRWVWRRTSGLEGLSIGALAEVTQHEQVRRVFAHFGSREELQISVDARVPHPLRGRGLLSGAAPSRAACRAFAFDVRATGSSGCRSRSTPAASISAAPSSSTTGPGPVRDALAESVHIWLAAMNRAVVQAREEGHLRADADENQVAFEIHALILALHYEARFLKNPGSMARATTGFDNILARYGAQVPACASGAAGTPL